MSAFDDPASAVPSQRSLPTARYLTPPGRPGFYERVFIPRLQAALLGETPPQTAIEEIETALREQD